MRPAVPRMSHPGGTRAAPTISDHYIRWGDTALAVPRVALTGGNAPGMVDGCVNPLWVAQFPALVQPADGVGFTRCMAGGVAPG